MITYTMNFSIFQVFRIIIFVQIFYPGKTLDKTKINPYHVQSVYQTFYNLPCATNISQLVFIVENKKKKEKKKEIGIWKRIKSSTGKE